MRYIALLLCLVLWIPVLPGCTKRAAGGALLVSGVLSFGVGYGAASISWAATRDSKYLIPVAGPYLGPNRDDEYFAVSITGGVFFSLLQLMGIAGIAYGIVLLTGAEDAAEEEAPPGTKTIQFMPLPGGGGAAVITGRF